MLDTTSTEAHDLIAAGYAEPVSSLAHQLALLANELRHERDQAEQRADAAIAQRDARQTVIDTAFARLGAHAAHLAASLGHDDVVLDDEERFFAEGRGPTPANRAYVSAMACLEYEEPGVYEHHGEQPDSNETLGLSMGGVQ